MCMFLLAIFGQSTIMMFVLYNRHIALMKHKLKPLHTYTFNLTMLSLYICVYIYIHMYIVHHMNVYIRTFASVHACLHSIEIHVAWLFLHEAHKMSCSTVIFRFLETVKTTFTHIYIYIICKIQ